MVLDPRRMIKSNKFEAFLAAITAVSLVLMLLPMFTHAYPSFINNGDVALHYKLSSLVHMDWGFLAFELYPKLFHIMVALLVDSLPILGIWGGMVTVTAAFVIFLPVAMYKLSMEFFGDRRVSILAAFFSVILMVQNSSFVGIALTVPQTLAMTLAPAILYFFLRRRWAVAGVLLGALMLIHGSWPMLSVFMFLCIPLMQKWKDRKMLVWLKVAVLSNVLGLAIYAPLAIHNRLFLFHDTINSTVMNAVAYVTPMLSVFAVPLIIMPFFSVILYVYGGFRVFRDRKSRRRPFLMLVLLAFILVVSQAFLAIPTGYIFSAVFIASRVLFLLFIPIAILCAYGLATAAGKLKKYGSHIIVVVMLLFIVAAVPYYYSWFDNKGVNLGSDEIAAAGFLSSLNRTNSMVLFNPLRYNMQEHFIVMTGLQDFNLTNAAFVLSGSNSSTVPIDYVLVRKGDSTMENFPQANAWRLSTAYENGKYRILAVKYPFSEAVPTIEEAVRGFSFFYNQNSKLRGILNEPVSVAVVSGGGKICARVLDKMEIAQCGYDSDITITGDSRYVRELFYTYSISEFTYKLMWFYGNGMINITTDGKLNITASLPKSIPSFIGSRFHFRDVGVYADIISSGGASKISLASAPEAGPKYAETSLMSISRITRWVLVNSWFTFPNVIWGFAYDAVSGFLGR